jgi:hypothetical protein
VVPSVVAGDKTAQLRLIKWTIVRLANHIRSFTLTGQPLAYKVDEWPAPAVEAEVRRRLQLHVVVVLGVAVQVVTHVNAKFETSFSHDRLKV